MTSKEKNAEAGRREDAEQIDSSASPRLPASAFFSFPIRVGARASPLSQVQAQEVLQALLKHYPEAAFELHFTESKGDLDQKTSLRTLDKTDFFTYEIDQMVLNGVCRIGIHSAKDLPDPLPSGLKMVALTRGIDPSDSLVLREHDTFETLPAGAVIATSSERREDSVRLLRKDLTFRDLRGTIAKRLSLLEEGQADGVVVAEAALIRLNLTHLNRIRLPGPPPTFQGQLAIIAREEDLEMEKLFYPLDSRHFPKALYLGPSYPSKAFPDRAIQHVPLIELVPEKNLDLSNWEHFTHVIFTSKHAVHILANFMRHQKIPLSSLKSKTILCAGEATSEAARAYGANPLTAKQECAEGIIELLKELPLENSFIFWPHSHLSRPLITEALGHLPFQAPVLYQTKSTSQELPDLSKFQEVLFSSPSTVSAFFSRVPSPPPHLKLTPIGDVTREALSRI